MVSQDFQILISLLSIPILLLTLWRIGIWRLKIYHSPILGKIEIFRKYNGEKLLTINSYAQGISIHHPSIKKSYWYLIARQVSKLCQSRKKPRILMLGLGAATIPTLISQNNPQIQQTIVEIDPLIIQACQDFFNLNQLPNTTIIQADAYQLFNKKSIFKQKFDSIIVDIFTGTPPYISIKSNQFAFIQKLLPYLKKNGLMIFNRPAHAQQIKAENYQFKKNLENIFQKVKIQLVIDPRGYHNHIISCFNSKVLTKN